MIISPKDNRETTLKCASPWIMDAFGHAACLLLIVIDRQLFLIVCDSQNCKIQPVKVSETTAFSKRIAALFSVSASVVIIIIIQGDAHFRACQRRSLHYK